MKLPRNVDGADLANHLVRRWRYEFVRQTGSHIRLRTSEPKVHAVTIPNHSPMKPGMLHGILKEVSAHKQVSIDELLRDL